ncbi:MAG: hypothetical protein AB7F99_10865 [Vicinamibacterales bacterium]
MANFCEHCQGQRFDRARVLRALRQVRSDLRQSRVDPTAEDAITRALRSVMALDVPHLEPEEEEYQVVH